MKYLLSCIAVTVAVSASAVDFGNLGDKNAITPVSEITVKKKVSNNPEFICRLSGDLNLNQGNLQLKKEIPTRNENMNATNMRIMQAKKISPAANTIEGVWEFQFGDYYFEDSSNGIVIVDYEATLDGDYVLFQDVEGKEFPMVATYDNSSITFDKEFLGNVERYYAWQESFVWNYSTNKMDFQPITGKYNASAGSITFPADNGIAWAAYDDEAATKLAGYFYIYDIIAGTLESGNTGGSTTSIEGTWEFTVGDYYFENSVGETILFFEASFKENGMLFFEDPTGFQLPFVAQYNAASNILTFPYILLGTANQYYVTQEPFFYNVNENKMQMIESFDGQFIPEEGRIKFPLDYGLAWIAYSDQNLNNKVGYYSIYDLISAKKEMTNPDDDSNWYNVGNALFVDGWVLPAFEIDQLEEENQYYVPLQKNIENPNLFRLVDPYHLGPIAAYNESRYRGYILFDVTDPERVIFKESEAGFALSDIGISKFYCYNMLGAYLATYPQYTIEQIIDLVDDMPFTTFVDGVVELDYADTGDGIVFDANFGIQGYNTGLYSWRDANMSAMIVFPEGWEAGVASIENNNSASRYFNLQGVEVKNPQTGGLYIKVTGSQSEKVIVK